MFPVVSLYRLSDQGVGKYIFMSTWMPAQPRGYISWGRTLDTQIHFAESSCYNPCLLSADPESEDLQP